MQLYVYMSMDVIAENVSSCSKQPRAKLQSYTCMACCFVAGVRSAYWKPSDTHSGNKEPVYTFGTLFFDPVALGSAVSN